MCMQWYHRPPDWQQTATTLSVTAAAKTDFWRKTHGGKIRDNGHFYYRPVSGDFIAEAKLSDGYSAQYDQAGLMVRLDEAYWIKCGVELTDGTPFASTVVTRDWSDWSVVALERAAPLWIRIERHGTTFTTSFSVDGRNYRMMRQAFLTDALTLDVGPMIAAPTGDGFRMQFDGLSIVEQAPV